MNVGDKVRVIFIPGVDDPREEFADSYTITSMLPEEDGTYTYFLDGNMDGYFFSEESLELVKSKAEVIKVMYHTNRIDRLEMDNLSHGSCVDLRCAEDIELKKGDFRLIPLGVSMKLPEGYEAYVMPRSSTFKRYGLLMTNSVGCIDEDYCSSDDQWMMSVLATRDTVIHANDRICQFRIIKHQPLLDFVEVESLGNDSRGGFGSTGVQ